MSDGRGIEEEPGDGAARGAALGAPSGPSPMAEPAAESHPPAEAPPPATVTPPHEVPALSQVPKRETPSTPLTARPAASPEPEPSPAIPGHPASVWAAVMPARSRKAGARKPAFWVGAAMVALAGIMVLASTWLPWFGESVEGIETSFTGWEMFRIGSGGAYEVLLGKMKEISGDFALDPSDPTTKPILEGFAREASERIEEEPGINPLYLSSGSLTDGRFIFTGLCSLIAGALILAAGALMFAVRRRWTGALAAVFSALALGAAAVNTIGMVGIEFFGPGAGTYAFLVFSALGLAGGMTGASA